MQRPSKKEGKMTYNDLKVGTHFKVTNGDDDMEFTIEDFWKGSNSFMGHANALGLSNILFAVKKGSLDALVIKIFYGTITFETKIYYERVIILS
jgi:hypothetical protein